MERRRRSKDAAASSRWSLFLRRCLSLVPLSTVGVLLGRTAFYSQLHSISRRAFGCTCFGAGRGTTLIVPSSAGHSGDPTLGRGPESLPPTLADLPHRRTPIFRAGPVMSIPCLKDLSPTRSFGFTFPPSPTREYPPSPSGPSSVGPSHPPLRLPALVPPPWEGTTPLIDSRTFSGPPLAHS